MSRSVKILLWLLLAAFVILLVFTFFMVFRETATEIKFSEYEQKIASGEVKKIVIDNYIYKGYSARGKYLYFAYGDRGDYTAQKLDEWAMEYAGFYYTYAK